MMLLLRLLLAHTNNLCAENKTKAAEKIHMLLYQQQNQQQTKEKAVQTDGA